MRKEKITWELSEPTDFPCMLCGKNRATWKVQLRHNEVTLNLCLCNSCSLKTEAELIEELFGRKED